MTALLIPPGNMLRGHWAGDQLHRAEPIPARIRRSFMFSRRDDALSAACKRALPKSDRERKAQHNTK
jgi:hypothetical protein